MDCKIFRYCPCLFTRLSRGVDSRMEGVRVSERMHFLKGTVAHLAKDLTPYRAPPPPCLFLLNVGFSEGWKEEMKDAAFTGGQKTAQCKVG